MDGEFNTHSTKGVNRPISIIQIIKDVKDKVSGMTRAQLSSYLVPRRRLVRGELRARVQHEAVTQEFLETVSLGTSQGYPVHQSLSVAKRSFFPHYHDPKNWREGNV